MAPILPFRTARGDAKPRREEDHPMVTASKSGTNDRSEGGSPVVQEATGEWVEFA